MTFNMTAHGITSELQDINENAFVVRQCFCKIRSIKMLHSFPRLEVTTKVLNALVWDLLLVYSNALYSTPALFFSCHVRGAQHTCVLNTCALTRHKLGSCWPSCGMWVVTVLHIKLPITGDNYFFWPTNFVGIFKLLSCFVSLYLGSTAVVCNRQKA